MPAGVVHRRKGKQIRRGERQRPGPEYRVVDVRRKNQRIVPSISCSQLKVVSGAHGTTAVSRLPASTAVFSVSDFPNVS